MLGAFARNKVFWVLDALRGGAKKKHYNDIADNADRGAQEKLTQILRYARENAPFYANINSDDLSAFPVMTKVKYRQAGWENIRSREYLGQTLHTVYTSGSTGTPFEAVQDPNKRNRVVSDLLRAHESIGWKLGDRYVFMRNWETNYNPSLIKAAMQNAHYVNIATFNEQNKVRLTRWLKRHKNLLIFGYSSALHEYALWLEQNGVDAAAFKVRMLVCDSDALTPAMATLMRRVFGCPVHNRYDNEENGLLGLCRDGSDHFDLNTASLYYELLKLDADEPVQPGEIGRIVITDLYNRAMPLIRYDTGDLAVSRDEIGQIRTFDSLCGRAAAVVTSKEGRLVSDGSIAVAVEPFVNVVRYQLIQHKQGNYTMKYVGDLPAEDVQGLHRRLNTCLGPQADITMENVAEIPCGSNGKHKPTVREA